VRLRATPDTTSLTIKVLHQRDTLLLIGTDSISANLLYLHVATPQGDTGWVSTSFAHRIRRRPPSNPPDTAPVSTASLGAAVPLPANSITLTSESTLRCGSSCGSERWRVKTLTDLDEGDVDFTPVSATVGQMRSFPHPAHTSSTHRSGDVERTTYQVNGRIIGWLAEHDKDIHLVIEALSGTNTIIAEIPNSACTYVCSSPKLADFNQARADVVAQLGNPPGSYHPITPVHVTITGVAFFDFKHHQNGLAPNAIELHPVLKIQF